mgnify:FL=1|jgi:hypothetical protein
MDYTYIKTKVKSITMDELTELQNSYMDAQKKNQTWIMQAMEKVFEDIDLGKIRIKGL